MLVLFPLATLPFPRILNEGNKFEYLVVIPAPNGDTGGSMSRSVPTSPGDKKTAIPVAGSAENLVGRVNLLNNFSSPHPGFFAESESCLISNQK